MADTNSQLYYGFEQGPIRPPSEAYSLLIRVTRNCPWNRCTFCHLYKGKEFSARPVEHVLKDIEAVATCIDALQRVAGNPASLTRAAMEKAARICTGVDLFAFNAACNWFAAGMKSVFLQDSNSLAVPPDDMVAILEHLRARFPWIERITSYSRSSTAARIEDADLQRMRQAGLNRIHIGLESGSDEVLRMVRKGATKELHVKAGRKIKDAGMELSEYYMPGLGGKDLYRENAIETADAMNQIDPDFIRLRPLAIPDGTPLCEQYEAGQFQKSNDLLMAQELLLFLEHLDGILSMVKSDHILNLFADLEGRLPEAKEHMIGIVRSFLEMDVDRQQLYQVGRRLGIFSSLRDLEDPTRAARAEEARSRIRSHADDLDGVMDELMKRFI
jgi:histone acetyltransferase (RNA polymerase elongator complex component)